MTEADRSASLVMQATAVAIAHQALLITGPPGAGKSSLALALIDRGATLIGDDGVSISRTADQLIAQPPPNIAGKLEIRNVGIVDLPTASAPLALVLEIDAGAERLPLEPQSRDILGINLPLLRFEPGGIAAAVRAEWALRKHGLAIPSREEE